MKSVYQDKWDMWHDKPCLIAPGEPSSNDSMILTAIGSKIGFPFLDEHDFWQQLRKFAGSRFPVERLPGKPHPYPSRDFMLGAGYFQLITYYHLRKNNWNFSPIILPRFDLIQLIKEAWQLLIWFDYDQDGKFRIVQLKGRNWFWMYGLTQIYRFAFMVPFQDRAFYYRQANETPPFIYRLIEWFDKLSKPKTLSSKFIAFLKYNYQPTIEEWEQKFQADHPFVERVRFLSLKVNK